MQYWDEATIEKIRAGFYSAVYFNRTQEILLKQHNLTPVTMQIFQKKDATMIAGVDVVISLLKHATGFYDNGSWINKFNELKILAVNDGAVLNEWETVLHISGPYAYFSHLESLYLGLLARASKIATNTASVVAAAGKKPVAFFADRFDYFLNQSIDGYAAKIGGIYAVSTAAHGFYWEGKPLGTLPHALIAIHNGNTIQAAESFAENFPDIPLVVLVDFTNDCVRTALAVARHFGKRLWGVRLDTSEKLIDISLAGNTGNQYYGVNAYLVRLVRQALDAEGFTTVKIFVSGGFTADKIKLFEKEQVPVDMYGVGSSLLTGTIDFTADIVRVNGVEIAKEGRKFRENKILQVIA